MTTPDTDRTLASETFAERARLAALLAELSPQQWGRDSACRGWRIREVVSHLTMPFVISTPRFVTGLLRAGMRFDRFADRWARADTRVTPDAELLARLRENQHHPWRPPGGGQAGALSHDLIHGLDITEPLGLPAPPPQRIALVLHHATERQLRYFGVDLTGVRLVDPQTRISIGDGQPVSLSAKDLLLVVTGRRPVPAPATAPDHP